MAFKMKGYNYPGKSPMKQYAGKNWNRAVKAKGDADNILLDPTSEGAYDIETGKTDVLKEGKHKADRISNFAGSISKLAGMAKEAKDKLPPKSGDAVDSPVESPTQEQTDSTQEKASEDVTSNEGGPKIKLDDETKGKLTEAGSKWASDIVGGLLGGSA